MLVCGSCSPKPVILSTADERGCIVGIVPDGELPFLTVWAPRARPGDLVVNATCVAQQDDDTVREIRRLTRPR